MLPIYLQNNILINIMDQQTKMESNAIFSYELGTNNTLPLRIFYK